MCSSAAAAVNGGWGARISLLFSQGGRESLQNLMDLCALPAPTPVAAAWPLVLWPVGDEHLLLRRCRPLPHLSFLFVLIHWPAQVLRQGESCLGSAVECVSIPCCSSQRFASTLPWFQAPRTVSTCTQLISLIKLIGVRVGYIANRENRPEKMANVCHTAIEPGCMWLTH